MHRYQIIDDHTKRFLLQTDPKPGRFYILPKIHKQGNPGRPIVSSNSHPTERISQFVDYHLKPLVQTTQSFIKDTTHFLNKLQQLGQLPNNAILVTLDVSSLYTNIPHNEGIDACRHFRGTRNRTSSTMSTETLCDLIRMILTMNNFTFNSTTDAIYKLTELLWEPKWLLLTPICFSPNLRWTHYFVPHSNHTYGGVS